MKRSLKVNGAARWARTLAGLMMAAALGAAGALAQEGGAAQGGGAGGGTTGGGAGGGTTGGGASSIPGGTGGIGGVGTTPGRPGTTQQPGQYPDNRQQMPDMQRMIFLSGKVLLEDGTPPPEQVLIERVCNGQPRPEAYTDQKGRFSFQLGQNQGVFSDASYGGMGDTWGSTDAISGNRSSAGGFGGFGGAGGRQITERDLMGCELRAVLPGYRSEAVPLSGRRSLDNPDIGTIVLRRLANVEGTTVSAIAMQAPKDAKKALEKAHNHLKKNKADEAIKEYEKALQIYPKYTTAYYEMGRILEMKEQTEPARQAYLKAIEIDPKYLHPYRQLAGLAVREQKWEDAADFAGKAIKLNPVDFAEPYFYHSVANYYLKKYEEAEASGLEARKLDNRNRIPKVHQLLGAISIERNDYAAASGHMKDYLKFLPAGQEADQMQRQIDELDKAVAARSGNR